MKATFLMLSLLLGLAILETHAHSLDKNARVERNVTDASLNFSASSPTSPEVKASWYIGTWNRQNGKGKKLKKMRISRNGSKYKIVRFDAQNKAYRTLYAYPKSTKRGTVLVISNYKIKNVSYILKFRPGRKNSANLVTERISKSNGKPHSVIFHRGSGSNSPGISNPDNDETPDSSGEGNNGTFTPEEKKELLKEGIGLMKDIIKNKKEKKQNPENEWEDEDNGYEGNDDYESEYDDEETQSRDWEEAEDDSQYSSPEEESPRYESSHRPTYQTGGESSTIIVRVYNCENCNKLALELSGKGFQDKVYHRQEGNASVFTFTYVPPGRYHLYKRKEKKYGNSTDHSSSGNQKIKVDLGNKDAFIRTLPVGPGKVMELEYDVRL